jgi:hypothetical protein
VNFNRSADGDRWSPDRPNLNPGFSNNQLANPSTGALALAPCPLHAPPIATVTTRRPFPVPEALYWAHVVEVSTAARCQYHCRG